MHLTSAVSSLIIDSDPFSVFNVEPLFRRCIGSASSNICMMIAHITLIIHPLNIHICVAFDLIYLSIPLVLPDGTME